MEDKKLLIEELADLIEDRLLEANLVIGSMNKGKGYWIAQKLVEQGYCKLPFDCVVIEKTEYDALLETAKALDVFLGNIARISKSFIDD